MQVESGNKYREWWRFAAAGALGGYALGAVLFFSNRLKLASGQFLQLALYLALFDSILLTAELSDGVEMDGVQVELRWKRGSGEVQTAVREPALRRLVWRLQPAAPGENVLQLKAADQEVEFPLYKEEHAASIATSRSADMPRQLIEPRGQYLSNEMVFSRIYNDYPAASYGWMVLFTVGLLIAALVANEAAGRFAKRAQR